jgi:hypothetical protein
MPGIILGATPAQVMLATINHALYRGAPGHIVWERGQRPGQWNGFVDGWWRFEVGPTSWSYYDKTPVGPYWPKVRSGVWPLRATSYGTLQAAKNACVDVLKWEER